MLDGHVFHLEGDEFTITLGIFDDFARRLGVDVHLDDASVLDGDDGIAQSLVISDHLREGEGLRAVLAIKQLHDEFGAVAIFERRIGVKELRRIGGDAIGGSFEDDVLEFLAGEFLAHAIHDGDKSRATGVDDARFF